MTDDHQKKITLDKDLLMFKRVLFGSLLFIIVFIGAALSFNYIWNLGAGTRAVEGYNPTMGKAYILFNGQKINSMLGYNAPLDTSLYRDSIIPIDSSKTIDILLPGSVDNGAEIKYELRSFDGTNLIEEGDFRFVEKKNELTAYSVSLRMSLTTGTEYSFVIKAEKGNDITRFYTRVVRYDDIRLSGFIDYAKSFSDAAYERNSMAFVTASNTDAVMTYNVSGDEAEMKKTEENEEKETMIATSTDAMEGVRIADITSVFSSADALSSMYNASQAKNIVSNGNPGYVTLGSSYEDVVYNGMKMGRLSDPVPKVKEFSPDSAIIELRYKAISEENNTSKTYAVTEYISLEYDNGDAAIKVQDYRRYVNQDFSADGFDTEHNSICLGITADRTPEYLSDESGKKLAFVADTSLWVVNTEENQYSSIYGTSSDEAVKERIPQEGYDIKLLNVDENVVDFVVYGRINEGPREGENGIGLYEYNLEDSTMKEIEFISSDMSLDAMRLSVGRFAYYDKKNRKFYVLMGDSLLEIDIFTGQMNEKISGVPCNQIVVSDTSKIVAFPDTKDLTNVSKITIINFDTGKEIIKTESGHKLALLGFVGNDIMYGTTLPEDVSRDTDGTPTFLFDKLYIVDSNGWDAKKYDKEGILVSGIKFEDNTIYLSRVSRNEETGELTSASDDYISYKPIRMSEKVGISILKNESENEELHLRFPDGVFVGSSNKELLTKVANSSASEVIDHRDIEIDKDTSYIYEASGISGVSYSIGKAVQQVYETGGFVVDGYGDVIYRERQSRPYLTVAGTFEYKAVEDEASSFAACNYMCILASGMNANYDEVRSKNDWEDSFYMYGNEVRGINISGVKLDTAIGYLSDGSPFAAKIADRYVLVVSYNADFVRYYDPIDDEEVRIQRYAFQLKCEDQGNEFYTYIK